MISAVVLDKARGYVGIDADPEWAEYVVLEVLPRAGEDPAAVRPDYGLDQFGRALRHVRKAHMRYLLDSDEPSNGSEFRSPVTVRLLGSDKR